MKTILVGTDFSARSDHALKRATLLAQKFAASIVLVNVVDDDQPHRIVDIERAEAERLLNQTAAKLRDEANVACETRVILASPFVGLAKAVTDINPDLLVIGPHRRQVLRDVFTGTTAERTIRSVDCPVLMVNEATPSGDYKRVLQTTDLSNESRNALQRFRRLGLGENAQNLLIYVFDAPALRLSMRHAIPDDNQQQYFEASQENAARDLAAFAASADIGDFRQITRHRTTTRTQEILKVAKQNQADLILVSTPSRSGLEKLLVGSVTEQILGISPIDVLVLPPSPGD